MIESFAFLRECTLPSVALRLILSMLFGGMLGIERGRKGRAAGFRTYMFVCMGAALTMLLSQYEYLMLNGAWNDIAGEIGIRTDVSRFGAQVINGIGFLGAGTIIVTGKQEVKGLTTAAGLWAAAIIGLTLGAGFYEGGILATILILLAELLFSKLEYHMLEHAQEINLYMEYNGKQTLDCVLRFYREHELKLLDVEITRSSDGEKITSCAIFTLRLNRKCTANWLLNALHAIPGVVLVQEL